MGTLCLMGQEFRISMVNCLTKYVQKVRVSLCGLTFWYACGIRFNLHRHQLIQGSSHPFLQLAMSLTSNSVVWTAEQASPAIIVSSSAISEPIFSLGQVSTTTYLLSPIYFAPIIT